MAQCAFAINQSTAISLSRGASSNAGRARCPNVDHRKNVTYSRSDTFKVLEVLATRFPLLAPPSGHQDRENSQLLRTEMDSTQSCTQRFGSLLNIIGLCLSK